MCVVKVWRRGIPEVSSSDGTCVETEAEDMALIGTAVPALHTRIPPGVPKGGGVRAVLLIRAE